MKRDPRLRGLSAEHHHALVLARSLIEGAGQWTKAAGAALGHRFDVELEPHFCVEDELLLPALRRAGATALVDRTEEDHAFLRDRLEAARAGDERGMREFAERLRDHVRFEESEVFPACEALIPSDILDAVARRFAKEP